MPTSPKPPRRSTLKTIADLAGVHPSTVSRALANGQSHRVDVATRERIQKIAQELNYEPDPLARGLRTSKSMLIGITVPRLTDFELSAMVTASQASAKKHGYETLIVSTENEEQHGESIRNMLQRRIDGLVIATAKIEDPLLEQLEASKVPFLLLNRESKGYPSVTSDDRTGAFLAVSHLILMGHQRIAHISGSLKASTGYNRYLGYRDALAQYDIEYDPELVRTGNFDSESAISLTNDLLKTEQPPTAFFTVNDLSALGVLYSVRQAGLRVPEDIAVVGYNNSDFSSLLSTPISSISVPIRLMGETATDLLIAQIKTGTISSKKFAPELIIRQSSDYRRG